MTRKRVGTYLSAAIFMCGSLPALAAAPGCYPINDLAVDGAVPQLAVVAQGPTRLHFLKSDDAQRGCPGAGPNCALAAFVVPGDPVVVTSVQGNYACTTYTGGAPKFSTTGGWLPLSALTNSPAEPPVDSAEWLGDWKVGFDREIRITPARSGAFRFNVTSTFAGQPIGTDGVHLPGYQATALPRGAAAAFSVDLDKGITRNFNADPGNHDLCRARFWLMGPYLVSSDNGCGIPENGTATGIYRLASQPRPPAQPAPPPQTIVVQPPPASHVVVVQPPPQPPQVVVLPGAQPRLSRAAAIRACSNEVIRQNNIAGTASNSVDNIADVYANGPALMVEGIWSATRNIGYQHGNFTCRWDGQFANVRLNVIAMAPPPPPSIQPHFIDRRPRQQEIDTPPFVDERPRRPAAPPEPSTGTPSFVDQRPRRTEDPPEPSVGTPSFVDERSRRTEDPPEPTDTPAFRRDGGDAEDNGSDGDSN